ncbi:MBL fold metallo-hydrolase [Verrucomicrobiaceae bacterium 227]
MSEQAMQITDTLSPGRFLFLGTSTSVGVPVIGCQCPTCTSSHPWDNRTRSSALLEGPWGSLLIDSGPDLREQALREGLSKVDAVLYTHEHIDHIAGFDELRAFCWHRDDPLPLYGSPETLAGLKRMYPWAFLGEQTQRGYIRPEARPFDSIFTFEGLTITPIEVDHGRVRTHGFRFDHEELGSLAYIPDVKTLPLASLELLHGLDVLVIDGLRQEKHSTHMSVGEALGIIAHLKPTRSYLTHLSHELPWEETNARLPANVSLAHDGLTLNFPLS